MNDKKIIVTKDKLDDFKNRKEKNKVKKVSFKDCELKDLKKINLSSFVNITWLDLSNNNLQGSSLLELSNLRNIDVLNISHNKIKSIPKELSKTFYNALIANDNEIESVAFLEYLIVVNTVVLSRNNIKLITLENTDHLQELIKFSISHNELTSFPPFNNSPKLKELRLNSNKISETPENIISKINKLKILDIGSNSFNSLPSIFSILKYLENFTFTGNPYCLENDNYRNEILSKSNSITIIDGMKTSKMKGGKDVKMKEEEEVKEEEKEKEEEIEKKEEKKKQKKEKKEKKVNEEKPKKRKNEEMKKDEKEKKKSKKEKDTVVEADHTGVIKIKESKNKSQNVVSFDELMKQSGEVIDEW